MPTVGEDCSVILDGHGYLVKPGSYRVEISKSSGRGAGGSRRSCGS